MVKIPSMDELKKMGSGLIDQAKAVKFGEMVDKVKAGIESVSSKKAPVEVSDEDLKNLFQGIFSTINELTETQATQLNSLKKIEKQMEDLAKVVASYQKPAIVVEPQSINIKPEDETNEPKK